MEMKWIETKNQKPVLSEKQKNEVYPHTLCLTFHKGEQKILAYNHKEDCWDNEDMDDYYCNTQDVSCWMELPDNPQIIETVRQMTKGEFDCESKA